MIKGKNKMMTNESEQVKNENSQSLCIPKTGNIAIEAETLSEAQKKLSVINNKK